jgi:hypothetical protein
MPTLGETETKRCPLDELEFDPENPRLSIEHRQKKLKDSKLLQILLDEFELEELAESFLENGFFDNEPLLAVKREAKLRVIEGNRRLAALKLLVDGPDHHGIKSSKFAALHDKFQKLDESIREELNEPNVCVLEDPKRAIGYLGFRHVTGIKPWPPLEKAGYISQMVEKHNLSPADIAPLIGTKPVYVSRHYQAYRLVLQARDEEIVDTRPLEQSFGVFMRSLQTDGVLSFIGIEPASASKTDAKPLKAKSRTDFRDFVRWCFGTETEAPLLRDSRLLTQFGQILRSEKSVSYLRSSSRPDFDEAFLLSGAQDDEARKAIEVAEYALRDALPIARRMRKDESFSTSLSRAADYMSQILVHFPSIKQEYFLE